MGKHGMLRDSVVSLSEAEVKTPSASQHPCTDWLVRTSAGDLPDKDSGLRASYLGRDECCAGCVVATESNIATPPSSILLPDRLSLGASHHWLLRIAEDQEDHVGFFPDSSEISGLDLGSKQFP